MWSLLFLVIIEIFGGLEVNWNIFKNELFELEIFREYSY